MSAGLHVVGREPVTLRAIVGAVGMAGPRLARLTARRAFVRTKHDFLVAVDGLTGARGDWVLRQVRAAEQPSDLWLLRGAVFDALAEAGKPELEPLLRSSLGTLFPYGTPATDFLCTSSLAR
ncbi:hypothetical protein CLD22_03070 [Rubrivivax gelatinosus]|nr:hypothetical protein [Rubrivivax gelatinosus]